MTAASMLAEERRNMATDALPPRTITWRDVAWLTWRQHRGLIIAGVVLAAAAAAVLLTFAAMLNHYGGCSSLAPRVMTSSTPPLPDWCQRNLVDFEVTTRNLAKIMRALVFIPAIGGAFFGAPLVAREIENGTLGLTLGQDLSARRWLWRKATVLGAILAVLAFTVGIATRVAIPPHQGSFGDGWDRKIFETGPFPLIGYAIAAFAIGATIGAIVRHTLAAVPIVTGIFFAFWYLLRVIRPHYLPASAYRPTTDEDWPLVGDWVLTRPDEHKDGAPFYYHPASQLHWMELVEAGVCIAVAAGLIALAQLVLRLRRAR